MGEIILFINKADDGRNNICGASIAYYRTKQQLSQRALADRMQLVGLDIDKNAIQRIECGKRFVTDIELVAFAKAFDVPFDALLRADDRAVSEKDGTLSAATVGGDS